MDYTLTIRAEKGGRLLPMAMAKEYRENVYKIAEFRVE